MSIGVEVYLQGHNFTEICGARPPAIGEENEVTSVDGRMSTHSSVSGKSEVSSATPRRTDIDLGFEPEGSEFTSPLPMYERWKLSLRNMLEDSEGIKHFQQFLLNSEQQDLLECWLACKGFRDFGTKNNYSNNSSAASSTTGPITAQRTQPDFVMRNKLAKKIFNKYIKKDRCSVSSIIQDATRQLICKKIKAALQAGKELAECSSELDASLFDKAQSEIEHYIEENLYSSFLKSDLFRQCMAQCESKHAKQSSQTSNHHLHTSENKNTSQNPPASMQQPAAITDQTGRPGYLPRLDEDRVWQPLPLRSKLDVVSMDKDQSMNSTIGSGYSQLASTAMKRSMAASHERRGGFGENPENHPAYPYLCAPSATKYYVPPASANASDNASSDATSDTLSITDGSVDVDGSSVYSAPQTKKFRDHQKRMVRHQSRKNTAVHYAGEEQFVPLTRRYASKQEMANLATEHPEKFFALLNAKLEKVVEDRRRAEILEAASEDVDEILNSHIERVMKTPIGFSSPRGNQSPPPTTTLSGNISQQKHRHSPTHMLAHGAAASEPYLDARHHHQTKEFVERATMQRPVNPDQNATVRKTDPLRRRKEVAIGMSQNAVPDVPIQIDHVDKQYMIAEWVKQSSNSSQAQPQNYNGKRKVSVQTPGQSHSQRHRQMFINRGAGFPSQPGAASSANQLKPHPMQPISQDPAMPLLDQPDASTTIEEVKRRLIEETERQNPMSMSMGSQHLRHGSYPTLSGVSDSGMSTSSLPYPGHESTVLRVGSQTGVYAQSVVNQSTGSDSVLRCDTSTRDGHSSTSSKKSESTTCVYYMPHEELAYKIHVPHNRLTLGQFKSNLSKKGNYKYYFKQYSLEVDGPVHFEIKKDDEVLPLWENNTIVAKVELCDT